MGLTLVTAPTSEPIDLATAKAQLNIEAADVSSDTFITRLITVVRSRCELFTRRQMHDAAWKLTLDRWPRVIRLPRPPLQTVSSIKYVDTGGTQQTLAAERYQVDADSEPGRIVPAWGDTWPTIRNVPAAIEVEFTCGYESAGGVPPELVQAMLMDLSHFEANRDSIVVGTSAVEMPLASNALMTPFVVFED